MLAISFPLEPSDCPPYHCCANNFDISNFEMSALPYQDPSMAPHTLILPSYNNPGTSTTTRATCKKTLAPGQPYLAKVNGRLVLARDKSKKPKYSLNLLGEAFGVTTKILHKRSKSVEKLSKTPIVINGITYVPQLPQAPYTAPIPQGPFAPIQCPHPQSYVAPKPTEKDLKRLKQIDAHFHKTVAAEEPPAPKVADVKTTITIIKHICAHCGRVRSPRYQHDNPIKPGEIPAPAFCRKCQRDAESTSCSESEDEKVQRQAKKSAKNKKKGKKHEKKKSSESSSEDEDDRRESPKSNHSKKSKQYKSSKESKRSKSEERILLEKEIVEEEERQGRGTNRRRVVVEDVIDADERPTAPPKKSSDKHASRATVVEDNEEQRGSDLPPKLPPKIRETTPERLQDHSPITQHHVFESVPVYHDEKCRSREVPQHFADKSFYDEYEPGFPSGLYGQSYERLPPKSQHRPGKVYTVDGSETPGSTGSKERNYTEHEYTKPRESFEAGDFPEHSHDPSKTFDVRDFAERSHFLSEAYEVQEPYVEETAKKRHGADEFYGRTKERDANIRHSFDDWHSSRRRSHKTAERSKLKRAQSDPTHDDYSNPGYDYLRGANADSFQPNDERNYSQGDRAPPAAGFAFPKFGEFTDGHARDNFKTADQVHYENWSRKGNRSKAAGKRPEYDGRANQNARGKKNNAEREDYATYFNDDLDEKPSSKKHRHSRRYRRDTYDDAELGHSDAEYRYSKAPPRAPTPPPAVGPKVKISRDADMQVVRRKGKGIAPPSPMYEVSEPDTPGPSRTRHSARNRQHLNRNPFSRAYSRSSGYASNDESSVWSNPFDDPDKLRELEKRAEFLAEQHIDEWNKPTDDAWMTMTLSEIEYAEAAMNAANEMPGFNDFGPNMPGYGNTWHKDGGGDGW